MSTDSGQSGRGGDALISALAAGLSYQEAADFVGCSKTTVARRMATPDFRARVGTAREEYTEMLRGRLLQAQPAAVGVLAELITTARSDADRIRAARALLEIHHRGPLAVGRNDLERVIERVVKIAFAHIPDEAEESFIREIQAAV